MAAPRPADQPRRHQLPPDPTRRKNGAASRVVSRAVAASPNSRPTTNWRRSTAKRCLAGRGAAAASEPSARRRPGSPCRDPARRPVPPGRPGCARPTASIASPTATICAWYQVVASWAVYQNTVPNAKNMRRRQAHDRLDAEAAEHPPADRHVDGGQDREDRLVVGRQSPRRDERDEEQGRQRRERDQATRRRRHSRRPARRLGRMRCRSSWRSPETG